MRNLFGLFFGLTVGAAIAASGLLAPAFASISCAFLALELSLAAFARSDYLFTSEARTAHGGMPSDTAQIAAALWLPYWFWGALIAALSLGVLGACLWACGRSLE